MRSLAAVLALLVTTSLTAQQQSPDLVVTLQPITRPSQGTSTTLLASLRNRTAQEIRDIDVDLVLDATRATLTAAPHPSRPASQWSCTNLTPRHVRCRAFVIAPGPDQFIPLNVTIDPAREGRFLLTGQASWQADGEQRVSEVTSVNALFSREVLVTNRLDSGAGSLRAAIDELNGTCASDAVPCTVRFALAEPDEEAWAVIRLATPLPPITSPDFVIDASREGGSHPPIELDGSLLATGHGLDIRGTGPAEIRGLAIGGFPWDGITISRTGVSPQRGTTIYNAFIGVHPDQTPNPNGSRGVTFNLPAAYASVRNCLVSANVRSGVFIAGGTSIVLQQNLIGGLVPSSPLGNGASGIFTGPDASDIQIWENTISGNAQFGIAIARGARGVRLFATNRIVGNGLLAIDHGLDGFSGYGSDPLSTRTPAPRVTSAVYDAANDRLTISGVLAVPDPSKTWRVTLYAPQEAWTDLPLPTAEVKDNAFTFVIEHRPTAPIEVTAYASSDDPQWSTSELAEPVFFP